MTHKDIYTKFMIEYDKANVTSSYPSLTEYEVATVLDKAYNALIAQKVTGNNFRRVALEGDLKAITDIRGLIRNENIDTTRLDDYSNVLYGELPTDYLYYVSAYIPVNVARFKDDLSSYQDVLDTDKDKPVDIPTPVESENPKSIVRKINVKLVNHQIAEKFMISDSNIPWIKTPVSYIENDNIYVVVDMFKGYADDGQPLNVTYIKTPNRFVKDIHSDNWINDLHLSTGAAEVLRNSIKDISYFKYDLYDAPSDEELAYEYEMGKQAIDQLYTFECNDTVAEELISLAVAFALENVESQRLNSKLNMRGLEA